MPGGSPFKPTTVTVELESKSNFKEVVPAGSSIKLSSVIVRWSPNPASRR